MKYAIKSLSAVAAAAMAAVFGLAAPGVADAATCGAGRACFFSEYNYTGTQTDVLLNSGVGCVNLPPSLSGLGNGGTAGTVWSGYNCTGSHAYAISPNFPFTAHSVSFCIVCRSSADYPVGTQIDA